jgi:hypothetical protein
MDSAVFGTAVFGVVTGVRAGQTKNRGAIIGSGKVFVSYTIIFPTKCTSFIKSTRYYNLYFLSLYS